MVPKNHVGHITITLAGAGTAWDGTTVFAVTGAATLVDYNVTGAAVATVRINTSSSTGTATITESVTGSATVSITVSTPTLSLDITSGSRNCGTTPTIKLTGTNTTWLQESGSFFTISGGTGASLPAPTVSTNTSATMVLTAGSATATLTITDTSTGLTVTINAYAVTHYHSRPGASIKLFLNFSGGAGHFGDFPAPSRASALVTDAAAVLEVWQRASEKYIIFSNIDVTTEEPGLPHHGTIGWAMIGGSGNDWPAAGGPGGGITPIGGFQTTDNKCTAFIFTEDQANIVQFAGDGAAHELGHLFGLNHQSDVSGGVVIHEYTQGSGGWCPIMGNPQSLSITRTTWWNGHSSINGGPDLGLQDDIAIIASATGSALVTDDVGNTTGTATPLTITSLTISNAGIIYNQSDLDVWSFSTGAGSCTFTISAVVGPTLDATLELLDSGGNVLDTNSPSEPNYGASITRSLAQGQYFLRVSGGGDYGDVGSYVVGGTVQTPTQSPAFSLFLSPLSTDTGLPF